MFVALFASTHRDGQTGAKEGEELKNCVDPSPEVTHLRCEIGDQDLNQQRYFPIEELGLFISTSSDPMWICDLETLAFLDVNWATENRYGYSREEFLRLTILDIRPIEDIPKILRLALHPNENRPRIDGFITRHRNKAGNIFEVEVSGEEIVYHGRPARLVIIHDRIPVQENIELIKPEERHKEKAAIASKQMASI